MAKQTAANKTVEIRSGDVVETEKGFIGVVTYIMRLAGNGNLYSVESLDGTYKSIEARDFEIVNVWEYNDFSNIEDEPIAAPAEAPAPEAASAAVAVTPEDIFTPDVFGTSSPEHLEAILERNALRAEVATLKAQLAAARAALESIYIGTSDSHATARARRGLIEMTVWVDDTK